MSVLVTGANGFIGRCCLSALRARGLDVHAVTSRDAVATDGVTWHRADLLGPGASADLVAEAQPTHLLHLAWVTEPGRYWTAAENLTWLAASAELFRGFADLRGRRAVLAGTCAEYRWDDSVCVEGSTPIEPRTLYGACKHALHVAAGAYASQAGVSMAWARLFFLYGPHERPERFVPQVIRPLLDGAAARCSHGRQTRDFMHVADVADALVSLLLSDVEGPVNIASGTPVKVADVARAIGEIVGRPELVRLGEIPAAPGEPMRLAADVGRLRGEVGWTPTYDLRSGLEDTVAWWRESSR